MGELRIATGAKVIWNSKTGPTEAEFRGQGWMEDGFTRSATIIVRPDSGPPFQITVPLKDIKVKQTNVSVEKKIEKIDNKRGLEVEQQEDGTWQGWTYRKIGREWHVHGATSRYDSEDKARRAAIALSKGFVRSKEVGSEDGTGQNTPSSPSEVDWKGLEEDFERELETYITAWKASVIEHLKSKEAKEGVE